MVFRQLRNHVFPGDSVCLLCRRSNNLSKKFKWFVSLDCSSFTLSGPGSSREFSTPGRDDKALIEEEKMGAF